MQWYIDSLQGLNFSNDEMICKNSISCGLYIHSVCEKNFTKNKADYKL